MYFIPFFANNTTLLQQHIIMDVSFCHPFMFIPCECSINSVMLQLLQEDGSRSKWGFILRYDQCYSYQTEGNGHNSLLPFAVEVNKVPSHNLRCNECKGQRNFLKYIFLLFHWSLDIATQTTKGPQTPCWEPLMYNAIVVPFLARDFHQLEAWRKKLRCETIFVAILIPEVIF